MMLPLAVAIFEAGDGEKFVTQTDHGGKQTSEEKRKALKQVMIKEGPRPGQVVLLGLIWTTSFFLALERMFNTQPVKKTLPTREYSIQPAENSSKEILILRNVDISYCPVWEPNVSDGDKVFWAILVLIPLLIGPVLASFLEFVYFLKKKLSKTAYPETPSVLNYWLMILVTSIVILVTYTINLVFVETYIKANFEWTYFTLLLVKYFVGSLDIIIVPLVIISMDKKLRFGVRFLYNVKRQNNLCTVNATSTSTRLSII